jgi:hypothetical protein
MTGKSVASLATEEAEVISREVAETVIIPEPRRSRRPKIIDSQPKLFHDLYLPLEREQYPLVLFASFSEDS